MAPKPSLTRVDKALASAATLAARSAKLSSSEKAELRRLAQKARKQDLTIGSRARCLWLLRKVGPKTLPKIPTWLRRLLQRREPDPDTRPGRSPSNIDPLDRLEKLGRLLAIGIVIEPQFNTQRDRILRDPAIATFGSGDDVDPLDRVKKVGELQEAGVITTVQASELADRILACS